MNISGFTKTTLLDYPNHLSSTVFTQGCNLRCPYCHNGNMISKTSEQLISEDIIFEHLIKRRNIIDGVCITGGEPTLQKDLIPFIEKIKSIGLKIKLDTNGTNPDVINTLFEKKLLDFIAMDIKNTKEKYPQTIGLEQINLTAIEKSINLIKDSGIDYQFRTTVIEEFHTLDDLIKIAEWLDSNSPYQLQSYKHSQQQLSNIVFTPFSDTSMKEAQDKLSKYYKKVTYR